MGKKEYFFTAIWSIDYSKHSGISILIPQKKKKKNLKIPFDPPILFLGICSKQLNKLCYNATSLPAFIVAHIIVAKVWNQHICVSTED